MASARRVALGHGVSQGSAFLKAPRAGLSIHHPLAHQHGKSKGSHQLHHTLWLILAPVSRVGDSEGLWELSTALLLPSTADTFVHRNNVTKYSPAPSAS